jgi:hypothetical protein
LLCNGSIAMFEKRGFARVRQFGENHCVVGEAVEAYATR